MIVEDLDLLPHNPLVTAFVFTFNQENLVSQTIDSILAQQCSFEYEIVICDDCSKDSTLTVCLGYQQQHPNLIRVVENDRNLGIKCNFFHNIFKYARGKYVASCAGDDWWSDPLKLQKQVECLENDTTYDLVHTYASVYIDKERKIARNLIGSPKCSFRENLLNNRVAALTMCFTLKSFKEYVEDINPMELPYSEDYPLVLWYSYKGKIRFLPEVTSVYRLLTHSLSHSTDVKKVYKDPLDFFNCGMYFVNHFHFDDDDVIKYMRLHFFIKRMRYAHLLGDRENVKKGELFFMNNGYVVFWILSKVYRIAGSNEKANSLVYLMERIVRRLHLSRKLFV